MTSMASTRGTSRNTKQTIRKISVSNSVPPKPKFHLLNIRSHWFISPIDQSAVNLDDVAEFGATDEHFLAFIRPFVRLKSGHEAKTWGAISRCELLNWIAENGKPNCQPKFFTSKREAEISVQSEENFDNRAQTEIFNSVDGEISVPNKEV